MRRLAAAAAAVILCAVAPGCAEGQRAALPPATTSSSVPASSSVAPSSTSSESTPASLPTVTYGRAGGRAAPPDHERLEIASDGTYSLQRSVRSPAVGRFRGQLTAAERAGLAGDAGAALAAGPLTAKRLPDAAGETITVDATTARFGGPQPAGPWGSLAARLRTLLVDLVRSPLAAVTLVVAPDGAEAHLAQAGPEPVTVDLSGLAVTVVLVGPDGSELGRWEPPPTTGAAKPVVAEAGWSLPLPFGHGLARQVGQSLRVSTRFGLLDGTERIAVLATAVVS